MTQSQRRSNRQHGFTLVELVMVITIMGVIGGMVAVFMKGPIDAYFSGGRRAALTDTADTVLRRIGRDIRRAVPNTVRLGTACVEFVPSKTGGRYRTDGKVLPDLTIDGTNLDFAITDSSFNMLGSNAALPTNQKIGTGDLIVVYNLGIPGSDVYDISNTYGGKNWVAVASTPTESGSPPETTIDISPGFKFPLASGSLRFQVVDKNEKMVAYVCDSNSKNLYRTTYTTITENIPVVNPGTCASSSSGTATASIIAINVDCSNTAFTYSADDQRNALVRMKLTLQDSSGTESVTLLNDVHFSNTP